MWSFFIFKLMTKKIVTIVFIVVFSMMLWVFVSLSGEYFYSMRLPITFSGIPQDYAVSNYSEKEVLISLKGQGWQLAQITFGSQPEFVVNVRGNPGEHKIAIRNALDQNRWLSASVQINEFSPEEIQYRIEAVDSKKVPIIPDIEFKFRDGFGLVSDVRVEPDSIVVRGPKSVVKEITEIITVKRSYTNLDNTVVENISLATLNNLQVDEELVKINFDVQKIVDKEFQDVLVEVKNIPPSKNLTLFPDRINVILRGGINLLGKLDKDEIRASVTFNQALKDTLGYLIPHVTIPDFTTFIDTKPNRLEYIIHQQ